MIWIDTGYEISYPYCIMASTTCGCWLIAAVRASCTMELIYSSWEVENEAGLHF
jgi:hypothetical protein